jgi:hypothetical protein
MPIKLRPLYVLRQIQIPWSELQPGDVFRTAPAHAADMGANEDAWSLALTPAEKEDDPEAGWGVVMAPVSISIDEIAGYKLKVPTMRISTERDPWVAPEPTLFGAAVDDGIVTMEKYAFAERAGAEQS